MNYSSLRDFILKLEKDGELVRVKEPVSTFLEMTEIQTRLLNENGPAVIFENVMTKEGPSAYPVLINLFGTIKRIAMGMNSEVDKLHEIGEMLAFFRQPTPPENFSELIKMTPLIKKAMASRPKIISKASCQELIFTGDEVDLFKLPIQTCWPEEPAPLITWPLVVTKSGHNKETDKYNLGIYRMQVLNKNTTIMRWLKHRGGAIHSQEWLKNNQLHMPVAVVIGADPATILAAVMPIPETLSEYQFAGLIKGKRMELIECKTVPIKVPASAEIVLEGHIILNDLKQEGPYGDHTGYYNDVELFPSFKISAITMRKNAIYLSTFTGRPPDEPSVLGEALNEIFLPLLRQQFPEIIDFWLPPEACSYRMSVVSIKKSYPGHASRIMMGIWGFLKQFMYTKWIIIVDFEINCRNWKEVMWAISTKVDPARDITIINNTPIDYLDFASPSSWLGSKIGIDATDKVFPETSRPWGKPIKMSSDIIELVNQKWKKYNIPTVGKSIWK